LFTARAWTGLLTECPSDSHAPLGYPLVLSISLRQTTGQVVVHPPKRGGDVMDSRSDSLLWLDYFIRIRENGLPTITLVVRIPDRQSADVSRVPSSIKEKLGMGLSSPFST
jgi:hypothetical protein